MGGRFERHDRGGSDRSCRWGRGERLHFPLVWNPKRQDEAFCGAQDEDGSQLLDIFPLGMFYVGAGGIILQWSSCHIPLPFRRGRECDIRKPRIQVECFVESPVIAEGSLTIFKDKRGRGSPAFADPRLSRTHLTTSRMRGFRRFLEPFFSHRLNLRSYLTSIAMHARTAKIMPS